VGAFLKYKDLGKGIMKSWLTFWECPLGLNTHKTHNEHIIKLNMVDYVTIGMWGTLGLQKALGTYTKVNITMIID
jgi:hypothetical protein